VRAAIAIPWQDKAPAVRHAGYCAGEMKRDRAGSIVSNGSQCARLPVMTLISATVVIATERCVLIEL